MTIYPVIMCGGSGTRLWPASRPTRPKQFIPLLGDLSSFQSTVVRAAGIEGAAMPVVIAGMRHREMLEAQLAAIGARATLILEPSARDSAAAMAAAAAWIASQDANAIAVFVSADHDIPDVSAFQAAAQEAAEAAREGKIVTLGVRPRFPSTAFGYIRPGAGETVRDVEAFVEKPDEARAARYVADGYLWNSGNFVVAVSTLLDELQSHAAEVLQTARRAVDEADTQGDAITLGPVFAKTPRISIDYAVMEKTKRAAVLPVSFAWADIGAWDAVLAGSETDGSGNSAPSNALLLGAQGCLVRAPAGVQVAVVGGRDLAVIIDNDAVLVCDLAHSQGVKAAGDHFGSVSTAPRFTDIAQARRWFDEWLNARTLPLWWSLGADHDNGGFHEALESSGSPAEVLRRARVAARQTFVYATCGVAGWKGPWKAAVRHGLDALSDHYRREDGLYRTLVTPTGEPLDNEAWLYDQSFILLALSAAKRAGVAETEAEALALTRRIRETFAVPGGFRESGPHPYQSNAPMHLFEAALAWSQISEEPVWRSLAQDLAAFALDVLIDPALGFVREFFDSDWSPASGPDGARIEPGHQFEWAWLLSVYAKVFDDPRASLVARRLYDFGQGAIDPKTHVAVNAVDEKLNVINGDARLWPQSEYLRAALVFDDGEAALSAANTLVRYLDNPVSGLWRDELRATGAFDQSPSPASSLYHLVGAIRALIDA